MNLVKIKRHIQAIEQRLTHLAPMHWDNLVERGKVCGNLDAAAKIPRNGRITRRTFG
jgi:hypothetical protein